MLQEHAEVSLITRWLDLFKGMIFSNAPVQEKVHMVFSPQVSHNVYMHLVFLLSIQNSHPNLLGEYLINM